jgi:hypothetical protein
MVVVCYIVGQKQYAIPYNLRSSIISIFLISASIAIFYIWIRNTHVQWYINAIKGGVGVILSLGFLLFMNKDKLQRFKRSVGDY